MSVWSVAWGEGGERGLRKGFHRQAGAVVKSGDLDLVRQGCELGNSAWGLGF